MAIADAPRTDIGKLADMFGNGLVGIDASYVDVSESVMDLQWPLSVGTYSRMRRDPKLTAVLGAITLPIRRATWTVDPAGCRDEVAQLVADDLGLPVLGREDEPGPARRRGVSWQRHLRMALQSLVYGHMPFEQRYDILNGQARLADLSERLPYTIRQIALDVDGNLLGIKQYITGDTMIPVDRLLYYCHEREGAAWQGQSLLRPAFGPWLLKHEMWRVHATSIRRFGMGVPGVEAPPGATPQQITMAQQLASAARVDDTAGMGLPPGFNFKLTGLTGSVPDALAFVQYLDSQMSQMVLAQFLDLGQTRGGNRALGETFVDVFMLAIQAIADEIAETATQLAVQMVDYNWGEDEPAPRLCANDIGTRQEVTATSLQLLLEAGAITPDPELEAYVRREYGLPERATPDGSYDGQGYVPPDGPTTDETTAPDPVGPPMVQQLR